MLAETFYLLIGGGLGGAAVLGVGAIFLTRLTAGLREKSRLFKEYAPKRARSLPEAVERELEGLRADLVRLLELKEYELAERVGQVIKLTQELFGKLKSRGDAHQANMAAVSYGDVLAKLNKALSDDYYFDMISNPSMWTRVPERIEMVNQTAEAISDELLQAIRDFNSHADVHYDVDLESILRRRNASDILKDLR